LIGYFDEVDFPELLLMRDPLVSFLFLLPSLLIGWGFVDSYFDGFFKEFALLETITDIVFKGD
jgi:hypothetical protein